jgi:hypothetical protein
MNELCGLRRSLGRIAVVSSIVDPPMFVYYDLLVFVSSVFRQFHYLICSPASPVHLVQMLAERLAIDIVNLVLLALADL